MSKVLMYCLVFLMACGATQKRSMHAADESWEAYRDAMAEQKYTDATRIARDEGLGPFAIRRAAYADMWYDIKNGVVTTIYLRATSAGLSLEEKRKFGELVFEFLVRSERCSDAADIAYFFKLPGAWTARAVACVEKKKGLVSALGTACFRDAPKYEITERKREFFLDIDDYFELAYWELSSTVQRCAYDKEELLALFDAAIRHGLYELGMIVVRKAEVAKFGIDVQALYRKVFRAAIVGGQHAYAATILQERGFRHADADVLLLVGENVKGHHCPEAAAIAYQHKLPDDFVEGVFASKKCSGSRFKGFERYVPATNVVDSLWFFNIALKYEKFLLAWALAERVDKLIRKSQKMSAKAYVLKKGYAAKAYLEIITLEGVDEDDVFQYALDHREEWFVASHAKSQMESLRAFHAEYQGWIERSYLRAMERGQYVLAVQIAEKYGSLKVLEQRCRLAFEMSMLGRDAKSARFILGICRLEDRKLLTRVAKLRLRQRVRAEREKRRKEKEKKKTGDDWAVKRD